MPLVASEESDLLNDPKYRLYVTSVDKALKSFEYTSEWADLISALGKLNKILLNHTKFPVIPRRMKISKRLAQCLHPALPSGVHLKALETYDIMFRTMGTNRLSQELFIYSSGLFPVLGHAATNVKPPLLGIYETHFVPLGERLGPGLNGFLSGVLPGLEEGTDYYDRTNLLLEKVCSAVNPFLFYSCLWECLVSNAAVRLPAIIFVLSHFDKHVAMKNQIFLMGNDVDTVVNGLCCCFQDESVLIQRSALDFLLVGFPMHGACLSRKQCQTLITSVLLTLLRRDMSLNRRLFAWLLGSEVASNSSPANSLGSKISNEHGETSEIVADKYFETYSKDLLISAIKHVLKKSAGQTPHDLRPYRILISLLDKSDIGPIILDDILFEVFRLLYLCSQEPGDRASNGPELLKSANLLFSSLEPRYLWQYVGVQFTETCCRIPSHVAFDDDKSDPVKPVDSGDPSLIEVCSLIIFLLDSLSLDIYSETFSEYLPSLFLHVITSLTEHCDAINAFQMDAALKLCLKILSKIRSPVLMPPSDINSDCEIYDVLQNIDHRITVAEPETVMQLATTPTGGTPVAESGDDVLDEKNSLNQTNLNTNIAEVHQRTKLPSPCYDKDRSPSPLVMNDSGQDVSLQIVNTAEGDNSTVISKLSDNDEDDDDDSNNNKNKIRSDIENGCVIPPNEQTDKDSSTMEKCLRNYKKFYVTFVYIVRLKLGDSKSIANLFECLIIKSSETAAEDRIKVLESVLKKIIQDYSGKWSGGEKGAPVANSDSATRLSPCDCNGDVKEMSECLFANYHVKDTIGVEWKDAVFHASSLLIELSTFQTSVRSSMRFNDKIPLIKNENDLPSWLKSLLVCCCWLGNTCVPLQLVTISTLLDLSILCRRTEMYKKRYASPSKINTFSSSPTTGSAVPNQVVTVVVFMPLLTANQLSFLENSTNVFQVIMHWLWLHLGNPQHEVKCAELICQLQNTLRNTDLIENCIEESLAATQPAGQRLHSFRKFVRLWHISREIIKESESPRVEDTFYRCMLKVLDYLPSNENSCLKLEAENWLFHSLLRGDCGRIMEPLLLILLSRSTARIGLSYAKIQQHLQCDNTHIVDVETNSTVYAICSIYGSALTYHLIGNSRKQMSKISHRSMLSLKEACKENNQKSAFTRSTTEGDSSDSEACTSAAETVVGKEKTDGISSRGSSEIQFNIIKNNTSCQEYVKKLPFVQNIPIFVNRDDWSSPMSSVDESNETSQSDTVSLVEKESGLNGCDAAAEKSSSKYNTLPQVKDRLPKSKSESKINEKVSSFPSLKDSLSSDFDANYSESSTWNVDTHGNFTSRPFHSSHAVGEFDSMDSNDADLLRSLSFSASEHSADSMLACKHKQNRFLTGSNGPNSNNGIAKAIVEDIITHIIDGVVDTKKAVNKTVADKEEEVDSAISCNSGCSSVTLEYEKDNLSMDEDEHICKKIAEELDKKSTEKISPSVIGVQFYSHMLLYCDIYDKNRILYTLQKFREIININARAFLFVSSTSIVPSQAAMVNSLMKHRNSIFARGFQCNEKPSEAFHKNTTYLEVLITVCFYYARSYYPNFGSPGLTDKDVFENKQVQIASIDLLTEIFFQLGGILASSENEMKVCVRELLNRCKVQKIALHCTWCCLCDHISGNVHEFVRDILFLNRMHDQPDEASVEYSRAFQVQYLRLLLSLVILENEIYHKEENNINVVENDNLKNDYLNDKPIIYQPLFFNLLKQMLESDDHRRPIHERVITFVIACLPYLKKTLAKIITNVIRHVCCNIEAAADFYKMPKEKYEQCIPFDYTVTLLDAVTILSHYCLLDLNSQLFLKPLSDVGYFRSCKGLFQLYSDFPNSTNFCSNNFYNSNTEAKESMLENLPKIFAAVSSLWQSIVSSKSREYENVAGSLLNVKNQILNLLNPIVNHHSIHFFISVAVVWKERKTIDNTCQKMTMTPVANKNQMVLINLLCSVTSVTPDILINSIHRIIKQRVVFSQEKNAGIEISILEVLVHYIELISIQKLVECWNWLIPLLREASNVSPQSQFLLCAAVNQFVNRLPTTPDRLMDKKDFKDLQDIVVKLVEICTQTAGAGLEQTTWLRRNLAVRDNSSSPSAGALAVSILFSKDNDKQGSGAQFSAAAQLVLAQLLIPLLDIIFINQEKEKCVTWLINVMYNITPYLRNHTQKNAVNFFACSQLLSSISGFPYTRKAWKKDAMDLLLDSTLFQMEIRSLKHWRTIIDNLMSQDISTFRDLLARVSINQNNTLNLFSSKDQEYELRSQLLKRLAFVILCCERDQFHKHMPDIQEKLADSLKLPQSTPGIQSQVFLCFRVLLLRMSSHHMTSLWPVIITEMVQVMLQMENELSMETEEFNSQSRSISGLDWSLSSTNSSSGSSHPHWLQLQLAAAKLLKLAVQLPADRLPQFQMYRWAFVGKCQKSSPSSPTSGNCSPLGGASAEFVPHVIRIASSMNTKYGNPPEKESYNNLLPAAYQVKTLQDLHSFFATLGFDLSFEEKAVVTATDLEKEIELDFLEQMPQSALSPGSQLK